MQPKFFRFLFAFLLTAVVLCSALSVSAEQIAGEALDWTTIAEAPASDFTYEIVEHTDPLTGESVNAVCLTGYTGSDSIIRMPEKIDGMYVRLCAPRLFENNTSITHVALPQYMCLSDGDSKTIAMFQNCTSLQQVCMSVERPLIPYDMFNGCTALSAVIFPEREANPFLDGGVGNRAFMNCVSLTSITLPEDVDSINGDAFSGCTALESVAAPGVKIIEDNAFLNCAALANLQISAVDPYYDGCAFVGCTSLKALTLTAAEENDRMLVEENGCYYLTESYGGATHYSLVIVLPGYEGETVTLREDTEAIIGGFAGSSVKHVQIPASVQRIDTFSFYMCPNLETVTVAEGSGLQSISSSAFYSCPALRRIDLSNAPAEVSILDDFDELPALEMVVYPGQDPDATPAPTYSEEQVVAGIEAALEPLSAQIDQAGFKLNIRTDMGKLLFVSVDTCSQSKPLNAQLLHDIAVAVVSAPEAGFPDSFLSEIEGFDFSETGSIEGHTYRLSLEMGYMSYVMQINPLNN